MRRVLAKLDSRIHLPGVPRHLAEALRARFEYSNPDYAEAQAQGRSTRSIDPVLRTWAYRGDVLSLPRGGTQRLREVVAGAGYELVVEDCRLSAPSLAWPEPLVRPWPHQATGVEECLKRQQCLVRSGTGSGKTTMALLALAAIGQRALVVVRDGNLLEQWVAEAGTKLGLKPGEVGVIRGSKARVGDRLTVALQQKLHADGFPLAKVAAHFGALVVDEVQGVGARTVSEDVDCFLAKYRLGFSADETRADGKECLVYDAFGDYVYEVSRADLLAAGVVLPVTVRLVPTDFRADWYRDAPPRYKDFGKLVEQMVSDDGRTAALVCLLKRLVEEGEVPAFVFTARREYSQRLADDVLFEAGIRSGLMLGSNKNRQRFREDKERLRGGRAEVAVGTYQAIGTGLDVQAVRAGVVATPLGGKNRQLFGQVRGRICRASPGTGKVTARIYVLWDRLVFPGALRKYMQWNDGDVEVLQVDGTWLRP